MFEEWDISSKVFRATTDNGQNIVTAIELLSLEHFPCLAHTLQLAIKKVYAISKVHMIIARCKKLVDYSNKWTKEAYHLRHKKDPSTWSYVQRKVSYH